MHFTDKNPEAHNLKGTSKLAGLGRRPRSSDFTSQHPFPELTVCSVMVNWPTLLYDH